VAIDRSKLQPVPDDMDLVCYRCRVNPADEFRWMKTPNGSKYPRGWCGDCLEGNGPERRRPIAGRKSKVDVSTLEPVPDGEEVTCYRCKESPAVLCKEMHTPNGSAYLRGWCEDCLNGTYKQHKAEQEKREGMPSFHVSIGIPKSARAEEDLASAFRKEHGLIEEFREDLTGHVRRELEMLAAVSKTAIDVNVEIVWSKQE